MANFCALCGNKLALFGSRSLICANEDMLFCSDCGDKLAPMDNPDRGRYLLEHGKGSNPEAMREFIRRHDERKERLAKLEPPTRPCPSCGGSMECKLKEFRIGADGNGGFYILGGYEQYHVDLYACPDCGKVELYTANFAAVQARKARQETVNVTCAVCGTTHRADIGCPSCALNAATLGRRPEVSPTRQKDSKVPWEK